MLNFMCGHAGQRGSLRKATDAANSETLGRRSGSVWTPRPKFSNSLHKLIGAFGAVNLKGSAAAAKRAHESEVDCILCGFDFMPAEDRRRIE